MKKITNFILIVFILLCGVTGCVVRGGSKDDQSQTIEQKNFKNVILIIGDGMGLEHIEATELYNGNQLTFSNWHNSRVNTDSIDANGNLVLTDSAAGATAISTGSLTINGYVGKDSKGNDLETIIDIASNLGKRTGVISTESIIGATPASFSGHSISRSNSEEIFKSQITSSNVNLLCGHEEPLAIANQELLAANNYNFCNDFEKVGETFAFDRNYWQFNMSGSNPEIALKDVTKNALNYLDKDEDGFFLMIEQAHIDKYAHSNDLEGVINCVNYLDQTVETIINWLGDRDDTLVIVTADHETGGLMCGAEVEYENTYLTKTRKNFSYNFTTTDHTNSPIGIFVYGDKTNFKSYSEYHSAEIIKNINTFDYLKNVFKQK